MEGEGSTFQERILTMDKHLCMILRMILRIGREPGEKFQVISYCWYVRLVLWLIVAHPTDGMEENKTHGEHKGRNYGERNKSCDPTIEDIQFD
jgi:hypothetical protein